MHRYASILLRSRDRVDRGQVFRRVQFLTLFWPFKVDTKTHYIVDHLGRTRLFHGVNAVEKVFPWHPVINHFDPSRSMSGEDARNLRKWGFNIVRLGTMWPGLEPVRGQYNMTYLKEIERIVNLLGSQGIVTILDLHQDLLSPYWCGEGVPDWAALAPNISMQFPKPAVWGDFPRDPNTGYASIDACLKYNFGLFYFSEAVNAGFQSLYDNVNGIADSFVGFWKVVATQFNSNPYVIGYELINEPWAGNAFKDPFYLLKSGLGDSKNLAPLYDRTAAAIRSVSDKLIFYESATVDQVWGTSNGFVTGPGGVLHNASNVYSYHSYCTLSDRNGNPFSTPLCDYVDSALFELWIATGKRLGGGMMMTEWGALSTDPSAMQQMKRIAGLADKHLQSWIWWQFKDYDDVTTASVGGVESFYYANGTLQYDKVKALSRTYAHAIVGEPLEMTFDDTNGNFFLSYKYTSPTPFDPPTTEIFVSSSFYYENGFKLNSTAGATCAIMDHSTIVHCKHAPGLPQGSIVQIWVTNPPY